MSVKIEWSEPIEYSQPHKRVEIHGRIGDLRVAMLHPDTSRKGGRWWVTMDLAPLPDNLDAMTYESKANERQAKATAQRIANAFAKIINGEASS